MTIKKNMKDDKANITEKRTPPKKNLRLYLILSRDDLTVDLRDGETKFTKAERKRHITPHDQDAVSISNNSTNIPMMTESYTLEITYKFRFKIIKCLQVNYLK